MLLNEENERPRVALSSQTLTKREVEVARLVAQGLPNKRMAKAELKSLMPEDAKEAIGHQQMAALLPCPNEFALPIYRKIGRA